MSSTLADTQGCSSQDLRHNHVVRVLVGPRDLVQGSRGPLQAQPWQGQGELVVLGGLVQDQQVVAKWSTAGCSGPPGLRVVHCRLL